MNDPYQVGYADALWDQSKGRLQTEAQLEAFVLEARDLAHTAERQHYVGGYLLARLHLKIKAQGVLIKGVMLEAEQ